jgi:hypothetical protein
MYQTTDRRSELNLKQDDMLASRRWVIERKPDTSRFFELEEAVVLDVILDDTHSEILKKELDVDDWPKNIDSSPPVPGGMDYSWIGRIRFRFLCSDIGQAKEGLNWAMPMENTGIVEYPLMNEIVIVGKYLNNYYYSKKLNFKSVINSNASFMIERVAGKNEENFNLYSDDGSGKYPGPVSTLNAVGGTNNYEGVLGDYFKFNHRIRSIRRYEGDTILESRFGSSIRFGAYDDIRENDNGDGEYSDGGGNPMILIRNRQAPINDASGFTAKGYTTEDINKDGSSIHVTSGKTTSKFLSVVEKPMISGNSQVAVPLLSGDQVVFNSDRLVFSSKANEMLFFAKNRIAMSTDSEVSIDAEKKITLTSMELLSINAPKVYLGDHAIEYEPAVLGRTACAWLAGLCDVLVSNIDTQISMINTMLSHFHTGNLGKPTSPPIGSAPSSWSQNIAQLNEQKTKLLALKNNVTMLMSSRIFVTGGVD